MCLRRFNYQTEGMHLYDSLCDLLNQLATQADRQPTSI
jgi:hypothetical protein